MNKIDKDRAILPVSYFGPVNYFRIISKCVTILERHENYQKRTIRNRARILSANGPLSLSVPLTKGKTNLSITEVGIAYNQAWIEPQLRSIRSAYGSAPYFEHYFDDIAGILRTRYELLYELNLATISYICGVFSLNEPNKTDSYTKISSTYTHDARNGNIDWHKPINAYDQVFDNRFPFVSGLSILDLLFNLGPEAIYIMNA